MKRKIIILTVIASFALLVMAPVEGGALEISDARLPKKSAEAQPAGGTNENHLRSNNLPGYEVELTGVLRLVGSAPHYEFVVTSGGVDHYIQADGEEKKPLFSHQGKKVKVKGIMTVKKNIYPNPVYNHEKRFISPDSIEIY